MAMEKGAKCFQKFCFFTRMAGWPRVRSFKMGGRRKKKKEISNIYTSA